MNGKDLLDELKKRLMKERDMTSVSDATLSKWLGVTQPNIKNYRDGDLTARQVANLMEKFAAARQRDFLEEIVIPIVEFLHIDVSESKRGSRWEIFSSDNGDGSDHPYYKGLKSELQSSHGIYIFHDSRGRAVYAGKAQKLSLWVEMNNAFNRDRGEVQNIKRVCHPTNKIAYKNHKEHERKIEKQSIALHDIASYCSAYSIPDVLISKFEALIVRAFANDLLNVRMEKI